MKKLLIMLMALMLVMLSFTACGDDDDNDGGNGDGTSDNGGNTGDTSGGNDAGNGNTTACTHEHVSVTKMGSPATCVDRELSAEITCDDCGKKIQEQTEGKRNYDNHGAFTFTASVSPTCTQKGNTPKTQCGWCGEIVDAGEKIDALGHRWVDNDDVAPTCTSAGSEGGQHCSVCFIENPDNKATVIPALDHKNADGTETWVKDTEFTAVTATCTENGKSEKFECSQCHNVKYTETPAKGHATEGLIDVPAVAATCVAEGATAGKKCPDCQAVIEGCAVIPVNPTAHGTEVNADTVCDATCSRYACINAGKKCSLCGVVTVQPEYGTAYSTTHSSTLVEVTVKEPTCDEKGIKHFKCSECGVKIMVDDGNGGTVEKSDEIPVLEPVDKDEDSFCDVCGECLAHEDLLPEGTPDGKCDNCEKCVGDHVDAAPADAVDGKCDKCGEDMPAAE